MSANSTSSSVENKSFMLTNFLEEFDGFHKNEISLSDGQSLRLAKICFYLQSSMSISLEHCISDISNISDNSLYSSALMYNNLPLTSSNTNKTQTLHPFCETDFKAKAQHMSENIKLFLLNECISNNICEGSSLTNFQYRKLEDENEIPKRPDSISTGMYDESHLIETSNSLFELLTNREGTNSDNASTCPFLSYERLSDSKLSSPTNMNKSNKFECFSDSDDCRDLNELLSDNNFLTISEVGRTIKYSLLSNSKDVTMDDTTSQSSSSNTHASTYSSNDSTCYTSVSVTDESTSDDNEYASLSSTTETDSSVSIQDSTTTDDFSVSVDESTTEDDHSVSSSHESGTDDDYFESSTESTTGEDRSVSPSTESATDDDRFGLCSDESSLYDDSSVSCLGYSAEEESISSYKETSDDYSLMSYSGGSSTDHGNSSTFPYDILINSDDSLNSDKDLINVDNSPEEQNNTNQTYFVDVLKDMDHLSICKKSNKY